MALLRIEDLHISFKNEKGENFAVKGIDIHINKGESLGLVGESGSGKSLSALSIMGLLPSQAAVPKGRILFNGHDLLSFTRREMNGFRGQKIAMIFQEPMTSLNPVMRCGRQISEGIIRHQKVSNREAQRQVVDLFKQVNLPRPEQIAKSYPHELSGGQKQRVMIAMAIANHPDLLIADEPTTALDVTVQQEILLLLDRLRRENNMALLFISHDLGVVSRICDQVAVMLKGEIVEKGRSREVFANPQNSYTKGLLACRPPLTTRPTRLPVIEDFLSGKTDLNHQDRGYVKPNKEVSYDSPLLKIENLQKTYVTKRSVFGKPLKSIRPVDEVSFEVFSGETLGLVGESGCGKTTLGRTILKLIAADSGRIVFDERDLTRLNLAETKQMRREMNIVFQDPYSSLNPRMSIGEAIIEPMIVHRLYGNQKQRKEKAIEILERVGLQAEMMGRFPHEFSGGQRQRIVIARALALQPRFIICDEAVSALDVSVQAKVLNLLNDLKRDFGFTYIFISHDLSVVRYMSDRIMVMKDGKIIETGDADDVFLHPQTEYTRKLISALPTLAITN